MPETVYTAITFAPVQGFIEKSRKLRDLYGSSFILSFLARSICDIAKAEGHQVISPALPNVTQGTPNQILLEGNFPQSEAQKAFLKAWKAIANLCRDEVEQRLPESQLSEKYTWHRAWDAWGNHAWEFFWAQDTSISKARSKLFNSKNSRAWTGVNWHGESSTLSGADAIAWYGMTEKMHPKDSVAEQYSKIKSYSRQLSHALPNSIVDETEQLSIPELIKRVLMLKDKGFPSRLKENLQQLGLPAVEPPELFSDINRFEEDRWTGWFQGDGDRIGQYLQNRGDDNPQVLNQFSQAMLAWGRQFQAEFDQTNGRIIYAGGDDFLGVLYRNEPQPKLTGKDVLDWAVGFPHVWKRHGQKDDEGKFLSVSVGFVWAAPKVPQRDVLQHCREAQDSAKDHGRDRIACRILFNGGNFLEWCCPWWLLEEELLEQYCDRNGTQGSQNTPNWTHIYNDVAALENRHGFAGGQSDVALALFEVYFGEAMGQKVEANLFNRNDPVGVLGNHPDDVGDPTEALNQWIISLAKVGFHLCSNT